MTTLRTPAELSKVSRMDWTAAEHDAWRLAVNEQGAREKAAAIEMDDVREYGEGDTVALVPRGPNTYEDDRSLAPTAQEGTRWTIRALTEGGHNWTSVDLLDLIGWVSANRPDLIAEALHDKAPPPPPSESVESDPINWSDVQHTVGNMHDDEEYQPVRVQLPDGSVVEAGSLVKDAHGQWVLIARARPA